MAPALSSAQRSELIALASGKRGALPHLDTIVERVSWETTTDVVWGQLVTLQRELVVDYRQITHEPARYRYCVR
jgi:hypothetical protein